MGIFILNNQKVSSRKAWRTKMVSNKPPFSETRLCINPYWRWNLFTHIQTQEFMFTFMVRILSFLSFTLMILSLLVPINATSSSWGRDLETCRSTLGYAIFLGNGIVSWLSRQQHNITLFSTKAEYVGMTEASKQISWIQNLLSEMRFNIKFILLLVNNQDAMFLASNPAQEGRTKHIEILEHYIHECIQKRSNFSIFLLMSREQISSQRIWLGTILRRTGSHYCSQDIHHE